jgi:NAD(P)-dependent dehydrogenase (short-subunit alcohol dehydrogenase family)
MEDLQGKVAVITGGASGIGRAVADRAAADGMKIVLADIEQGPLKVAVDDLTSNGAEALGVVTDVSEAASVQALRDRALDRFGAVHLVHNNAGIGLGGPIWEVSEADWRWILGVNLWGVVHGVATFTPLLIEQGEGHIVNTASVAGVQNRRGTNQGPYSMSKYAVLSLSEALEQELEGSNVSVSVLCPGPINTNIARGARNRPEHLGGPQIRATDEAVLAERLATTGLDPKIVGERVVDAIRTKTFYAFVSAVPADVIRARHRRIEEALSSKWVTHY